MPKISNRRIKANHNKTQIGKNISFFDGTKKITKFGAGDSFYIHNFIKRTESRAIFEKLLHEVEFVQMFNLGIKKEVALPIPRMVSAQTCKSGDVSPIYRMPGCNQENMKIYCQVVIKQEKKLIQMM